VPQSATVSAIAAFIPCPTGVFPMFLFELEIQS